MLLDCKNADVDFSARYWIYICMSGKQTDATYMKTLTIYTKSQCTFIADCITIAGDQLVITLDKGRGIKLYPLCNVLLIEPTLS